MCFLFKSHYNVSLLSLYKCIVKFVLRAEPHSSMQKAPLQALATAVAAPSSSVFIFHFLFLEGKNQLEFGSLPDPAFHPDFSPMGLHQVFHAPNSQAGSPGLPGTGLGDAVEAFLNPGASIARNPAARTRP